MKHPTLSMLLTVFSSAAACLTSFGIASEGSAGQDPGAALVQRDAEIDARLLRRAIAFEVRNNARAMQTIATDQDTIKRRQEMRYVAVIRLAYLTTRRARIFQHQSPSSLLGDLWSLTFYEGQSLLFPDIAPTSEPQFCSVEYFSRLIRSISKERLPAKELWLAFSGAVADGCLRFGTVAPSAPLQEGSRYVDRVIQFELLAPTEDSARELAKTLVLLLDWGLTRQIQVRLHDAKREIGQTIEEKRKQLDEATTELERVSKAFEVFAEGVPDSLIDLRRQRQLVSVDIAAVKARISAAVRLLTQKEALLQEDLRVDVERMRITADIELAGLEAASAVNSLITLAKRQTGLERRAKDLNERVSQAKRFLLDSGTRISELDQAIEQLGPFQFYGGAIVIQPVEWATPSSAK